MSNTMREQFEDMMSSQGEWPQAIEKNSSGGYKFTVASTAWNTWQDAWEAGQRETQERVEKLEAENAELRRIVGRFIAETQPCYAPVDEASSEGIRAALEGLFETEGDPDAVR